MSHSRHADRASSPEQSEHPRKRQKTIGSALSGDEDAQFNTVRQSKACANCRKVAGSYVASNLLIEQEKVHIEDKNRTLKTYEDYETLSGNPVYRTFCGKDGK